MNFDAPFTSRSESDTEEFATRIARHLPLGTVIALHGDLGAGKTVFTRGFARGLGITEPVSSPTYTIIQEYRLPDKGWLFHLDLYRIDDFRAALAFGVEEYLDDPEAYVLAEWPERIAEIMPPGVLRVKIEHISDSERRITCIGGGLVG
jgi:tRNA threonylcarbamoyladenosine biosynthesis protein TsaE